MRKFLTALILLLACPSLFATTNVTGQIKTLSGTSVSNAYVRFWLRGCRNSQPRVTGVAIVPANTSGDYYFDFPASPTGAVSGTLYSTRASDGTGNGEIECNGSYVSAFYGMQVFRNSVGGAEISVHAINTGTIDIASVAPIQTTPLPPPAAPTAPMNTVSLGNVATGAPGSDLVISNSGTPTAAVFNFIIPAGSPGPQGSSVVGPQGPQGPPGIAGGQALLDWNLLLNKPSAFPPTVPTTSAPGGVFLPAPCATGQHISSVNTSNGELECSPDLAPGIDVQANGVSVGTNLRALNFVASSGLNLTATVNQSTGVITFTITGSTATQAQSVVLSPLPGLYGTAQTVTMTCASASPTIYYTTDSSTPDHSSTVYSTPVSVTNATLKAICSSPSLADSNVNSGVYSVAVPAVTLSASSLAFGNVQAGQTSPSQSITLTNSGNGALSIASISASTNFSSSNNCGSSLLPLHSCTVVVTFTPPDASVQSGALTFTDGASDSPQTVSLSGTGAVASVSLSPASLTFSAQPLNTTSSPQTVTLTNSGLATLSVSSVLIAGTNAAEFYESNNCISVGAGGTCTITVSFTPTAAGTRTASVTISDNAASSPQSFSLSGTGSAPAVTPSPSSLSFGGQLVGTTSAGQGITITNSGNANLTISSVALGGNNPSDFGQTNNCSTVTASSTCTITVTFSPQASGTRSAVVTVTDNASGSPHTMNVSGTGTSPAASLSPAVYNFGDVQLHDEIGYGFTLTNTGTVTLNINSITLSGSSYFSIFSNTCSSTLAASASCVITVDYAAGTVLGTRGTTLSVSDNAPGSPHQASMSARSVPVQ